MESSLIVLNIGKTNLLFSKRMSLNLSLASHFLSGALVVAVVAVLAFSTGAPPLEGEFTCSGRPAAAEIFEGIIYGCKQLEPNEELEGLLIGCALI
jgi:hypothetical protein